jgi:hypothetical protein
MSGGEDIPTNTINDTSDVGIKEIDLCFNLVRARKNEAANGARMGNTKIKMEFSLTVYLYGCWLPWKWGEEPLYLSPYLVPVPSTNRAEQQDENQIQKEKKNQSLHRRQLNRFREILYNYIREIH